MFSNTFREDIEEFGWKKAVEWKLNDLTYPFKNFYRRVSNLIAYAPLIWNDADWDHTFFLEMMEFKLRRMSKHFTEHDIHANSERVANDIKICAELCKRIREDRYDDIPRKQHERIYGESRLVTYDVGNPRARGLSIEYETAPRGSERQIEAREKSVEISKKAEEQMERDLDYLFLKMRKELRRWWC